MRTIVAVAMLALCAFAGAQVAVQPPAQLAPPGVATTAEAARSPYITHGLIGFNTFQGGGPLGLQPLALTPAGLAQLALPGQPPANLTTPTSLLIDRSADVLGPQPLILPVYVMQGANRPNGPNGATPASGWQYAQPPVTGPTAAPITGPFALGTAAPLNPPTQAAASPQRQAGLVPLSLAPLGLSSIDLRPLAPAAIAMPILSLDRPLPPASNPPTMTYGPSAAFDVRYLASPVMGYGPMTQPAQAATQPAYETTNPAVNSLGILGRFAGFAGPILR